MGADGSLTPEIYFHSPCFDGIASAVLAFDFLERRRGWSSIQLHAVTYGEELWTQRPLSARAAVVDFLYHPKAFFWADHHDSTFGRDGRLPPERSNDPFVMFDSQAPSCAAVIQEQLERRHQYRNHQYDPLVWWATKIDSASYNSVQEAVYGNDPALRIDLTLQAADEGYPEELVRALLREDLSVVASSGAVDGRFSRAQSMLKEGLERFRETADCTDDIVTFDLTKVGGISSRYAPYYWFPRARYSVGIIRSGGRVTITAMRNPWWDFEPVHLGRLFQTFDGGGHERIGAVRVEGPNAEKRGLEIRDSIVTSLRQSIGLTPDRHETTRAS